MSLSTPDLGRLPEELQGPLRGVAETVAGAGGRAWLVGGTVRDLALGERVHDLDLEVFGLPAGDLQAVLENRWLLDAVGTAFGILKLKGLPIDVGLPRRESKSGQGHRGFVVNSDPHLDLPTAAARRDYTINSLYLDPLTGELADPWGGWDDLEARVLRHTSPAFVEDPLRVLRGAQFAARFCLEPAPETVSLCRTIGMEGLAPERVYDEWRKLLLQGREPSRGLRFLQQTGWLKYFPELEALIGVPQDPVWHPEGDAWQHTLHCMDAFADERSGDEREDLIVGLAVLCHDLGKPLVTRRTQDGRLRSLGHEQEGLVPTRALLERLVVSPRVLGAVEPLVAEHMRPSQLYEAGASDAAIRRLAVRVGRIDRLVRVARADSMGRPPRSDGTYPAGEWLLQQARRLHAESGKPAPLILGRHLIELGAKEGPVLGSVLERLYEEQIQGKFDTEGAGIERARQLLRRADGD